MSETGPPPVPRGTEHRRSMFQRKFHFMSKQVCEEEAEQVQSTTSATLSTIATTTTRLTASTNAAEGTNVTERNGR